LDEFINKFESLYDKKLFTEVELECMSDRINREKDEIGDNDKKEDMEMMKR